MRYTFHVIKAYMPMGGRYRMPRPTGRTITIDLHTRGYSEARTIAALKAAHLLPLYMPPQQIKVWTGYGKEWRKPLKTQWFVEGANYNTFFHLEIAGIRPQYQHPMSYYR